MKKLIEQKGIKTVSNVDYDKVKHLFVYTEDILAKWVFIELYEEVEDAESDEGYKTGIYVYMIQESNCYEFTILFDPRPYVAPIDLYRKILDTVEIIENSDPHSLTENLKEVAMTSLKTDDYSGKHRQDFNQRIKLKIQEIWALIEQNGNTVGMHKSITQKRHFD